MQEIIVNLDGKEYAVNIEEVGNGKILIRFEGNLYQVETKQKQEQIFLEDTDDHDDRSKDIIKAPLPGTVVAINVKVGEKVKAGDSLATIVAMKMENNLVADKSGTIKEIRVKKNQNVDKDDVLMVIN